MATAPIVSGTPAALGVSPATSVSGAAKNSFKYKLFQHSGTSAKAEQNEVTLATLSDGNGSCCAASHLKLCRNTLCRVSIIRCLQVIFTVGSLQMASAISAGTLLLGTSLTSTSYRSASEDEPPLGLSASATCKAAVHSTGGGDKTSANRRLTSGSSASTFCGSNPSMSIGSASAAGNSSGVSVSPTAAASSESFCCRAASSWRTRSSSSAIVLSFSSAILFNAFIWLDVAKGAAPAQQDILAGGGAVLASRD
mmetsp:Transcript_20896/g.53095  ORF Transcript_20896/g.53095 Transcript_20896/m.53095 type:complete len:253 (-) Transcript_20896:2492-3250(-)